MQWLDDANEKKGVWFAAVQVAITHAIAVFTGILYAHPWATTSFGGVAVVVILITLQVIMALWAMATTANDLFTHLDTSIGFLVELSATCLIFLSNILAEKADGDIDKLAKALQVAALSANLLVWSAFVPLFFTVYDSFLVPIVQICWKSEVGLRETLCQIAVSSLLLPITIVSTFFGGGPSGTNAAAMEMFASMEGGIVGAAAMSDEEEEEEAEAEGEVDGNVDDEDAADEGPDAAAAAAMAEAQAAAKAKKEAEEAALVAAAAAAIAAAAAADKPKAAPTKAAKKRAARTEFLARVRAKSNRIYTRATEEPAGGWSPWFLLARTLVFCPVLISLWLWRLLCRGLYAAVHGLLGEKKVIEEKMVEGRKEAGALCGVGLSRAKIGRKMGILVVSVEETSVFHGKLTPGDELHSINGVVVSKMSVENVANVLRDVSELRVCARCQMPPYSGLSGRAGM